MKTPPECLEELLRQKRNRFGLLERFFAEYFLSKHFEKERPQQKENLLDLIKAQSDYDPEYDEEPEVTSSTLQQYRLELVRNLAGTLGVRPSFSDLAPYATEAIRSGKWDAMEKIVALSREGKLDDHTQQVLLLEALQRETDHGGDDYKKISSSFPDTMFTDDVVQEYYTRAIGQHRYREFSTELESRIFQETGIPISPETIESVTDRELDALQPDNHNNPFLKIHEEGGSIHQIIMNKIDTYYSNHLKLLAELVDLSEVDSRTLKGVDEKIVNALPCINYQELESPFNPTNIVSGFNTLFPIHTKKPLTRKLQKKALEHNDLPLFGLLYTESEHKLPPSHIQAAYQQLHEAEDINSLCLMAKQTQVTPKPRTAKAIAKELIRNESWDALLQFTDATGYTHQISRKDQQELEEKLRSKDSLAQARRAFNALQTTCAYRPSDSYLQSLALETIETALSQIDQRGPVQEAAGDTRQRIASAYGLLEDYKVPVPDRMVSLQPGLIGLDFLSGLLSVTQHHSESGWSHHGPTSPLEAGHINNRALYHHHKRAIRKTVNETIKKIKQFKKAHPDIPFEDAPTMQHAYQHLLHILLVQAVNNDRDRRSNIPLADLVQETGIPVSKDAQIAALRNCKIEAYPSSYTDARDYLQQRGIQFQLDADTIDSMLVDLEPHSYRRSSRFILQSRLTGTPITSERVRNLVATISKTSQKINVYRRLHEEGCPPEPADIQPYVESACEQDKKRDLIILDRIGAVLPSEYVSRCVEEIVEKKYYSLSNQHKELVQNLSKKGCVSLTPDQEQVIREKITRAKGTDDIMGDLSVAVDILGHTFEEPFETEEQERVYRTIERDLFTVTSIHFKFEMQTFFPLGTGYSPNINKNPYKTHVPVVISDPDLRRQAAEQAAEKLAEGHLERGWVFARIMDVKPAFTPEQYRSFLSRQSRLNHWSQFRATDIKDYHEQMTTWAPEGDSNA